MKASCTKMCGFDVFSYMCVIVQTVVSLQEVLLNPDGLPLLIQYSVFDDLDQVFRPCPGLGLQGGVKTRDALQLLFCGPTQPQKLLL